jgi:hypothetical protein
MHWRGEFLMNKVTKVKLFKELEPRKEKKWSGLGSKGTSKEIHGSYHTTNASC